MPKNTVPRSRRASAPKKPETKSALDIITQADENKLPFWVNETREELSYVLLLTDQRSDAVNDSLESIDLTRAEYISLKRHLAIMRGYAVMGVTHA